MTSDTWYNYSVTKGFFAQDNEKTDDSTFDYTKNFGLVSGSWGEFPADDFRTMNGNASGPKYKVLFLGRHGQGFHNVGEEKYGTKAWDGQYRYSMLDGDDELQWADAHLTPLGIEQARLASQVWKSAIDNGLQSPESYYCSPHMRCLETAYHTFSKLSESGHIDPAYPFVPEVRELIRETIGVHTCDRRSTKSEIEKYWKAEAEKGRGFKFVFEKGFKENDETWDSVLRERDAAVDRRALLALDDIFSMDSSFFISITAHSGLIAAMLRVIGHRPFKLATGAVIPVFIKAEPVLGTRPPSKEQQWDKILPREPPYTDPEVPKFD